MSVLSALFGAGTWGTGGNIVAAALLAAGGMLLRDRIGRRLAAWWHTHHGEQLRAELAQHLAEMEARLRAHAEAQHAQTRAELAADAPARGGAGSNPAEKGLPADGRVVPPPAASTTPPAPPPPPAPAPQPAPAPKEA